MPTDSDSSGIFSLSDDVLILICGYLTLKTQLELTKLHHRFLDIMPSVWRSSCQSINLSLIELQLGEKDLSFFLESTQRTLKALRFRMEDKSNLQVLTQFVFPNLYDFRFSTHSFALDDSVLSDLIRSFPNLKTFSPHGMFTGKHFDEFQFLENLTLSFCGKFEVSNLICILKTRNIKTLKLEVFDRYQIEDVTLDLPLEGIKNLEFLQCDREEMDRWFLNNLQYLSNLKQLLVSNFDNWPYVKRLINSLKRNNIKTLEINLNRWNEMNNSETLHINELKLVNAIINPILISTLEHVNEIHLSNCLIHERGILTLLILSSRSCDILDLHSCQFGFDEYTFLAQQIGEKRSKLLNVFWSHSTCLSGARVNWKMEGEHPFLKLHKKDLKISYNYHPVSICFY
ncbi:uncharacterized protein LOC108086456 [Drosophila ficusphila]|uniref:uncharacterized protein LOC108086456 n=1 Tax=Drosophila ficusphila TaxID=30025 RepID=UPI0007E777D1|nr:uncharacterized protein LOC108086456 [Drosophila ficusphila]XP_017038869.1 uncharacterized protein LOC108086456 [Drosophila ficusphila]XP_017038870.1 uncharacterized protein LOC108086456 [Drosophila ficusphila]